MIILISNRMRVAKKIGEGKKESHITVLQPARYNEIVERALRKGKETDLSEEFMKTYVEAIRLESIRVQNNLREIVWYRQIKN